VELQDVEGFPMGEGLGDYEDLLEGFEAVANIVAALVHGDQVPNEDHRPSLGLLPSPKKCKIVLYLRTMFV
jgi:hypothetical protein